MSDTGQARLRERLWVEKRDHRFEPPRVVEEIALEDGRVVAHARHCACDAPGPGPCPLHVLLPGHRAE
jgi:hypothetical protein